METSDLLLLILSCQHATIFFSYFSFYSQIIFQIDETIYGIKVEVGFFIPDEILVFYFFSKQNIYFFENQADQIHL